MADASGAVQAAIIAKLRGDAGLQEMMTPAVAPEWNIFDQGGSGQTVPVFPYIYVHPITTQLGELLTFGMDAQDLFLLVNVFTKAEGFAKARAIAARCYQLLHGPIAGPLSVAGFTNVLTLFDNSQELEEVQDGLVQHIAARYKLEVQG